MHTVGTYVGGRPSEVRGYLARLARLKWADKVKVA